MPSVLSLSMLFLLLLLIKNTEIAADGIKKGVAVVENVLLPTLFPLLVISNLFLSLGALRDVALLPRPLRRILGISRAGSVSFCLGLLLGVPTGALLATKDLEAGYLEKDEHRRLVCLTATPSMGFLVGVVGGTLFGAPVLGVYLYCATLCATLTLAIGLRLWQKKTPHNEKTPLNVVRKAGFAEVFTASVRDSMRAFLQIAAFVLTFSALSSCLSALTDTFRLPRALCALLGGVLELTAGVMQATDLGNAQNALLLISFFAGFAGLSVMLQVLSVTGEHAPPFALLLGIKLAVGMLTLLFMRLLLLLPHPAVTLTAETVQTAGALRHASLPIGKWLLLLLPLYLFIHRVLTKPLVYFTKENQKQ